MCWETNSFYIEKGISIRIYSWMSITSEDTWHGERSSSRCSRIDCCQNKNRANPRRRRGGLCLQRLDRKQIDFHFIQEREPIIPGSRAPCSLRLRLLIPLNLHYLLLLRIKKNCRHRLYSIVSEVCSQEEQSRKKIWVWSSILSYWICGRDFKEEK